MEMPVEFRISDAMAAVWSRRERRCSVGTGVKLDSDAEEKFSPVHPVQNHPEHQQNGGALQERLVGVAKHVEDAIPEVRDEVLVDKALKQIRHTIYGDGTHPYGNQRDRRAAEAD
jgi:hypothetical protein